MTAQTRAKFILQLFLVRLKNFIRTRGTRYLMTGAIGNILSMAVSNILYQGLKPLWGVVAASVSCMLVHGLIIYSGHFFFTFTSRTSFFTGFVKSLSSNIPITIFINGLSIYILKRDLMPYWVLQVLIMAITQMYFITVNLLWVFRPETPEVPRRHGL